jgi:cytochrome c-type biogenesis protein CcmF
VFNNLFLTTACATVFVGTLYPLALEALTGEKISVGAPFFNATFGPLFVPLLIAVPFGPLMAWKRGDLKGVTQRLTAAFVLALLGVAAVCAIEGRPVLAAFGIGLAIFVIAGAITDIVERTGLWRAPLGTVLRRAAGLPRSAWGSAFAHIGLGISLLGIIGVTQWGSEQIVSLRPGDKVSLRQYEFTFDGTTPRSGPNYSDLVVKFTVRRHGERIGVMEPAKRTFATRQMTTTEAALLSRGFSQLYVSLGDTNADGSIAVRIYHKPLVLLIWLGCIVMVFGGGLSLSDRRLRVGAPKPAKARTELQPAE